MAIQMRRGLRQDFDPTQLVAGEWAVSVDSSTSNQIVWMCFGAGVVKRMGTYEDFQAMIEEITDDIRDEMLQIESEVQTLADAVGDDKDAVATMKTAIEQTDLPAIQQYVTTCQTSAQNASQSASNASGSATQASASATEAESWAVGGTGTRQGEDTNNAKYWSERAQSASFQQSDWTENDPENSSYIAHKPFKTVGTGLSVDGNGALNADGVSSYNDLSNKPQINGNVLSGNKTNAQLGIPTKTSDLTNDSGFITDIPVATANTAGKVKPDGTTTTVDQNGVISVIGGGGTTWDVLDGSVKKNLLNLSYDARDVVSYGIHIIIRADGTVTLDGTATGDVWGQIGTIGKDPYFPRSGNFVLSADYPSNITGLTLKVIAKQKSDDSEVILAEYPSDPEFTITDYDTQYYWVAFRLYVDNGTTINDLTFRPMIRRAEISDDTIETYYPDNIELSDKIKGAVNIGTFYGAKNMLNITAESKTDAGITFTVNEDGSVTADGTATALIWYKLYESTGEEPFVGKKVTVNGCPAGGGDTTYKLFIWKAGNVSGQTDTYVDKGNGVTFTWLNDGSGDKAVIYINIYEGQTLNNVTFYPMIRLASVEDDTYAPYAMTNLEITKYLEGGGTPTTTVTVTLYSASNDTVAFTDASGSKTATTDSTGKAQNVSITFGNNSPTITFTSSVAKDPSDLNNDYSKTITITSATTEVEVMPEARSKMLYWWGYMGENAEEQSTSNGWSSTYGFTPPTYNTNYLDCINLGNHYCGIASKNPITGSKTVNLILQNSQSSTWLGAFSSKTNLSSSTWIDNVELTGTSLQKGSKQLSMPSGGYLAISVFNASSNIYAMWYE